MATPMQPGDRDGARVEGQDAGGYDAAAVAASARQHDPGLPAETAALLAEQAWPMLRELGELDAPALSRSLMAANTGVGATPCNMVATAAVSYCQVHALTP